MCTFVENLRVAFARFQIEFDEKVLFSAFSSMNGAGAQKVQSKAKARDVIATETAAGHAPNICMLNLEPRGNTFYSLFKKRL